MVFAVVGGDGKPTGYDIDNSLRFRAVDSPRLTRSQANGNQDKWTWSSWVKRSVLGSAQCFFATTDGSATSFDAKFDANDNLDVYNYLGGGFGARLITNRKFRDVAAWYHIVIVYDSGNGTEANRLRIYVNGTEESSFSTTNYPSQNEDSDLNVSGSNIEIGRQANGSQFFDGYMAEVFLLDGQAKAPTDFGKTDDNGVWIPKDAKANLTFGTNGFYMEFQQTGTSANASGMGADTSGNTNHFSVTNIDARDVCTDSPTNNFCTFNYLDNAVLTLLAGACQATHSNSSGGEENRGTMGFANGKWYWEFQIGYELPGSQLKPYGIGLLTNTGRNPLESDLKTTEALTVHWYTDTSNNQVQERIFNTTTTVNASESFADNGDIVQFAIDADAGKVWVGKNNTWLDDASGNVGDPANGNNPIHTYTVAGDFIFPAIVNVGSQGLTILLNTGNPSFAISSGNADGNGYGNFEYAVPNGFYSICSKNLAEYG
jgi:hypothetical protein